MVFQGMNSPRSLADIPISKMELIVFLCSQLLKATSFRGQIHADEFLVFLNTQGEKAEDSKASFCLTREAPGMRLIQ